MNIEDKIKCIDKNLRRARKSGNFRRIHKWENVISHARRRMCPWNPLCKRESLFRVKDRLNRIEALSGYKLADYKWDWCGLCKDAMVSCPKCGSNCCNAGYGRLRKDGTKPTREDNWEDTIACPICTFAYDVQEFADRLGKAPSREAFPNADQIERDYDTWWTETFEWLDDEEKKRQTEAVNALFSATSEELGASAVKMANQQKTDDSEHR